MCLLALEKRLPRGNVWTSRRAIMKSALVIFWLGVVLGQDCGFTFNETTPENERIVHGIEAKKGAWPWIVSMLYNNSYVSPEEFKLECGGSIINSLWIVTAAHCFDGVGEDMEPRSRTKDWQIESGEHELYTKDDDSGNHQSVTHHVEMIVRHEDYQDPYHPHDIAMVKVKEPFVYNKRVQPICLPAAEDEFNELEQSCFAAGWGEDFGTAENKNVLQQIHSEIVELDKCIEIHNARDDEAVHGLNICFGDGRKGTCMGDSGGPLMCKRDGRWYFAGLTSWGNTVCMNLPGVFTKVAGHRSWILDQIAKFS